MTLHDLTTLCGNARDKTAMSQHPGLHLLIVRNVLCKDGNDNCEQLFHSGEFGSKMHEESTDQMMNQVMTPFQQQFGKPCLCRATLSVWEKVCLCRGI